MYHFSIARLFFRVLSPFNILTSHRHSDCFALRFIFILFPIWRNNKTVSILNFAHHFYSMRLSKKKPKMKLCISMICFILLLFDVFASIRSAQCLSGDGEFHVLLGRICRCFRWQISKSYGSSTELHLSS